MSPPPKPTLPGGDEPLPKGVRLVREFGRGPDGAVGYRRLAFSPDGQWLAASSQGLFEVWSVESGRREFVDRAATGVDLAWSPEGTRVVCTWVQGFQVFEHRDSTWRKGQNRSLNDSVWSTAWAGPDTVLAGTYETGVFILDLPSGHWRALRGSEAPEVYGICPLPGGRAVTVAWDGHARCWDLASGQEVWRTPLGDRLMFRAVHLPTRGAVVVSHGSGWSLLRAADGVVLNSVADSDGAGFAAAEPLGVVAAALREGPLRLHYLDSGALLAELPPVGERTQNWPGLSFHPTRPWLAAAAKDGSVLRIYELDLPALRGTAPPQRSVRYTNAKVVLLGDSGVGKTGLFQRLTKDTWVPTESTHKRNVATLERSEGPGPSGMHSIRELVLWDLAGQPGYRLVHQLHLHDVAVAVLVCDASNEDDPLGGVRYWQRALAQASRRQGKAAQGHRKLLVVARCDRGTVQLSPARLQEFAAEIGASEVIRTSARTGENSAALRAAILGAVRWDEVPHETASERFVAIERFLTEERASGAILVQENELYRRWRKQAPPGEAEEDRATFRSCLRLLDNQGQLRRLAFGDHVLMQPELLDAFAAAMVDAARNEPDGLGALSEARALAGDFPIPADSAVKDPATRRMLLLATVEDLLACEVAVRESTDDSVQLVFPAQLTRERADLPDPPGRTVRYTFTGPAAYVYASLVVRLSHASAYGRPELWRNAAELRPRAGGACGVWMRAFDDGTGEIVVFHRDTSPATRVDFEHYVHTHLLRTAAPQSLEEHRVLACPVCATPVSEEVLAKVRGQGRERVRCPVCDDQWVSLVAPPVPATAADAVTRIDQEARAGVTAAASVPVIRGKREAGEFDVFLCHNSADKPAVRQLYRQLLDVGLLPWLDEEELRPGLPWQRALEAQIGAIKTAAVCFGAAGAGPWQQHELEAFLREFTERGCPVIPVILPDAKGTPKLPIFLKAMTWVDLREDGGLDRLRWGITGEAGRR